MTDKKVAVDEFDEASGTLPAGFEFGAYVIGACVGRGGMARVYRAEHRALRKPVALKVMDGALLERPDWRRRFMREGQAAAAVKHPNVVDITDVGVWQGRPYLVMEYLQGEDLEHYLEHHKPLSEAETARLMIPVIAGLATAHASGVVHRDLKPSNVFLARGPEGEVVPKLLDFGISKLSSALDDLDPTSTPHGELMGSPMYMSPEAVRGARDLSPQSDQYSLGVVLYECVTGRPPFPGDSLLAVLEAVAHGSFDPPRLHRPDLSRPFEEVILRAMSAEPQARFDSVRDVGRVLCHLADHRTRLLWMPSFGSSDALEGRTTALLGTSLLRTSPLGASPLGTSPLRTSPLRTVAPLQLPTPVAARRASRRSQVALGVLALAVVGVVGWRQLAALPSAEAPSTVRALQPSVQVGTEPSERREAQPAVSPPAPAVTPPAVTPPVAPAAVPAAVPLRVPNDAPASGPAAAPEPRRIPEPSPRTAPQVAPRAAAPPTAPRAAARRAPPRTEASTVATPPRAVPVPEPAAPERRRREVRALGPNRAPLLD